MYATTFSNNSVLRVDISKFQLTCEWLTKHGVKFEAFRYIRSTGDSYAVFEFISAPQSVIDAHNAKFNPTPVVESTPVVKVLTVSSSRKLKSEATKYAAILYNQTGDCRPAISDKSMKAYVLTSLKKRHYTDREINSFVTGIPMFFGNSEWDRG